MVKSRICPVNSLHNVSLALVKVIKKIRVVCCWLRFHLTKWTVYYEYWADIGFVGAGLHGIMMCPNLAHEAQ